MCQIIAFDEVADQTLAFILAATRGVTANSAAVHGGRWGLAVPLDHMRTLRDLQVGVVGFGRIGRAVVQRLLAFGCQVLVHDPVVNATADRKYRLRITLVGRAARDGRHCHVALPVDFCHARPD